MNVHEVYPNAPLALVAMELRHPQTEPLGQPHIRALKEMLGNRLPIMRRAQQMTLQGSGGFGAEPVSEDFPKFFDRDSTVAVSFRSNSIVIEATRYLGWQEFKSLIELALSTRAAVTPLDGVERIGLRYIDEIRVPGEHPNWTDWVDASMMAPTVAAGASPLPLSQWQGVAVYGTQPGMALVLRYGPREGTAVDPAGELRRLLPAEGNDFFLMDIDSFWVPEGGTPEFDFHSTLEICDGLHQPIRGMFEALITDRLRDEVLRNA